MTTFDDLASFQAAVVAAVADAAHGQSRSLIMVDPDFADWPLDDSRLIDALVGFARLPGRQLTLLAQNYDRVRQHCPRFTAWRTTFGHAVDARVPQERQADLPSALIVDRALAIRVDERLRWRGEITDSAPAVHRLWQQVDALMQRAEPGFAPTTLGL